MAKPDPCTPQEWRWRGGELIGPDGDEAPIDITLRRPEAGKLLISRILGLLNRDELDHPAESVGD